LRRRACPCRDGLADRHGTVALDLCEASFRDGGDPRVAQVIAARHRLNTGRVGDAWIHGLSRKPIRDGAAHALAIRRLDAAVDEDEHMSKQYDSARGTSGERGARVVLAAANEQLAAREAWVKYIEHGY
jgi:hypothetical protein